VVWSEPNISQIEAWSLSIYAWYQDFEKKKKKNIQKILQKIYIFLNFKFQIFKLIFNLKLKIKVLTKKIN
jgi:hypothetical protein